MQKRILKLLSIILLLSLSFSAISLTVNAASESVPYDTYTYWESINGNERKAVYDRPMFECDTVLSAHDMGLENFKELIDVCVAENGYVYLLDTNSRIVVLDTKLKLLKEITVIESSESLNFSGAKSIYVDRSNNIYICDTENARVLICDKDGRYIDEYNLPDSSLIPSDFSFKPIRVISDSKGYVYVLSDGSYNGALLYAPDKSFIGFYGTNSVNNGILGAIKSLFTRMFPNNEKSANSKRRLPYCFTDIVIDGDDFVYTSTDSVLVSQIKKLSPGEGINILKANDINFQDDEVNRTFSNGYPLNQRIVGLSVDKSGFIYGLDASYGRIFVYTNEGGTISAFGGGMGEGTQYGTFMSASAIDVYNDKIFVTDKTAGTLSIFKRNSYGEQVLDLIALTLKGEYELARDGWFEVLSIDKNMQMAYSGIARAYLAEENYNEAMKYAKLGTDRETYSLAFEYYRNDWLLNNFQWIFISVIAFIVLITVGLIVLKKKNISVFKNEKLITAFGTLIHPNESFENIKYKNMGSWVLSGSIIILFYVSSVSKTLFGGFMFTDYDPATYNSLLAFVQSAGLIILWIVSNWLVCSLLGGNGNFKEITTVSTYCLIPVIIGRVIWTFLSNFLLLNESAVLGIISAVAIIYAAIILISGMLKIHDFTMYRFIGTTLLTVIGIAIIVFLLILIGILLQQLGGFAVSILIEIFL